MTAHRALLRAASWLVPSEQRAEWLSEWRAELWYVGQSHNPTRFCLGAFRDAWWLRANPVGQPFVAAAAFSGGAEYANSEPAESRPQRRIAAPLNSPVHCILLLASIAFIAVFFSLRLHVPRQVLVRSPYPDAKHLVTIETGSRRRGEPQPTVTFAAYHTMNQGLHRTFSGVAFYQPIDARVGGSEITVAIASANLFDVLGVSPSIDPPRGVSLILSRGLWRKRFAADPRIAGRELSVAGQTAIVAGVIDDDWWRLPGRAEAWLLVDDAHLDALVSPHKGFAVGRLWPSVPQPRRSRLLGIFLPNASGDRDTFTCLPVSNGGPLEGILAIGLIVALLLPTIAPIGLGEYPWRGHPFAVRMRRWIFLGLKLALIVPIVLCGVLDLASPGLVATAPLALVIGLYFAFRWVLNDQRGRCPVCLRPLTNGVRMGSRSQTFLQWYGTELICAKGHGLLHVPEVPNSCYSTQRWHELDPSWSSLFI